MTQKFVFLLKFIVLFIPGFFFFFFVKMVEDFIYTKMYTTKMVGVETQLSVKILCSDLGGEYFLSEFVAVLDAHGTIHQSSCSNTPAQNGRGERKHCHLLDDARTLLLSSFVPSLCCGKKLYSLHLIF